MKSADAEDEAIELVGLPCLALYCTVGLLSPGCERRELQPRISPERISPMVTLLAAQRSSSNRLWITVTCVELSAQPVELTATDLVSIVPYFENDMAC